ncbi:hypothetical protein LJ207_09995 [Halanaerobium sp. Z-7514]|uniref:Sulfotransferase n=1 Tax=Halanaerobium polyolivorans TaxID=2886943 RepID=A0AAW4X1K7_9FIRM|nr:hypothetical protein [Halanaerobium polyolivorans]MCC3145655.1 hypothetical protein [Halanaerobium polyolivorans]
METFNNIINIAGFGWSGSSALVDLLKELDDYQELGNEFRLIKDPDGLIDLENAIVNNWKSGKDDIALKRFIKFIEFLGRKQTKFSHIGKNYNELFNYKFFDLTYEYISELINFDYKGNWFIYDFKKSHLSYLVKKIKKKLNFKIDNQLIYFSCHSKDDFTKITQNYLNKLFASIKNSKNNLILDQAICSSNIKNIQRSLKYFDNTKLILVDRDPRDIFIEAISQNSIPTNNIKNFIKWYKSKRPNYNYINSLDKVMLIQFEDLVLNFNDTFELVMNFLEEDYDLSKINFKFFDPSESIKNIGMYMSNKYKKYDKEIKEIEKSLGDYCYDFD